MATIAEPMIEPRAMPASPSHEPTALPPRFSGSKPINMTLMRNGDTQKPTEVPMAPLTTVADQAEPKRKEGDRNVATTWLTPFCSHEQSIVLDAPPTGGPCLSDSCVH